jgi:coenzyme F420-0:L-glutamate ligase/coenzyme F420-1:gamma-L-glutamate ligase
MRVMERMILTALPGIPLIEHGDDLGRIILNGLGRSGMDLRSGDVIVVASKVVSKAEGRVIHLSQVTPSQQAEDLAAQTMKDPRLVELVLSQSHSVLRTRPGLIIVEHKLGFVCANAGIDHSNVSGEGGETEGWVVLLPEDPDASAARLAEQLRAASGQRVGCLIIDSHGRAWRMGTVGVAIGVAEFPALVDLRGETDLFGNVMQVTEVGLADEVAAAASALMGQIDEGRPIVHVRGLPYPLRHGDLSELLRPRDQDLFRG